MVSINFDLNNSNIYSKRTLVGFFQRKLWCKLIDLVKVLINVWFTVAFFV